MHMILDFYKKALPSKGVYCVADIDPETKRTRHKFVESIDDLVTAIEDKKQHKTNVFVALSSFSGYSRKADEAQYVRSFFVDLDVGPGSYLRQLELTQVVGCMLTGYLTKIFLRMSGSPMLKSLSRFV
jgi:hypothetical protein